jgi:2-polyprenyl-3-methyl-5-hydroxy-6-metoxy-1,4-benzoquinol methylase
MFRKFGKSSAALLLQKKSFFEENKKHIDKQKEISNLYIQQPLRTACKNCNATLPKAVDFEKDLITYKICKTCTHLNGSYEDTDEFCQTVYTGNEGKNYAENYNVEDIENFNYRVSSIYIPKAEFLYSSLKNDGKNPNKLSYLDFGSGTGYFTSALKKVGITNIMGSEVSRHQVDAGNKMIGENLLQVHDLKDTNKVLAETTSNVVSMIGVLEHLQDPRSALDSIAQNPNIQYLYISVPLFSLSVYIEMLSNEVFHRHLHGGHTHLYTTDSLSHAANEFNLEIVSEWWFGTDIVDLYRNIFINLESKGVSPLIKENYSTLMNSVMDSLQLEIDKKQCSSEVHMLLKKKF